MRVSLVTLTIVTWLLLACSTTKPVSPSSSQGSYCEPSLTYAYNERYAPLSPLPADSTLTNSFSQHDLLMANAIGILPLLQEVIRLKKDNSIQARLERLTRIQEIQNRLLVASSDIASLAAELDCEGERSNQLAVFLDQKNQKRVRTLNVLSICIGGFTTVATALTQSSRVDKIVGISGGLLSALLGGTDAFSPNKSVSFTHRRNLLVDVWNDSEHSSMYSPFVWYVLNTKPSCNDRQQSVRSHIRQRWREYVLADSSEKEKEVYFGEGGNYVADVLHNRSDMLNQLQSAVRSVNQDLQSLIINLGVMFR